MNQLAKGSLVSICLLTLLACSDNEEDSECSPDETTNQPPEINIATQFQVATGGNLIAKANVSDCDLASVEWLQTSGVPITVESNSNEQLTLKAPAVTQTEEAGFTITATDSEGQETSSTFTVFVHPYLFDTNVKQIDVIPATEQNNSLHFIEIGDLDGDENAEILVNQKVSGDTTQGKTTIISVENQLTIAHEIDTENGYFGTLGDFLNNGRQQLVFTVRDPNDTDWNGYKWELVDDVLGSPSTYPLTIRSFDLLNNPSYQSRVLSDLNNNDKEEITFHADLDDDMQTCELTLNQQSEAEHECRNIITSTGEFVDGIHDHPGRAAIIDLNQDGLPDEIETRQNPTYVPGLDENPTYTIIKTQTESFTFITTNTFQDMEWVTQIGDLTGDGYPELVYEPVGTPVIYQNEGNSQLDFSPVFPTESLCRSYTANWNGNSFPNSIAAILDMDGDGDNDMLCRYNGRWIENLGFPSFSQHAIAIDLDVIHNIEDFDNDGDMDIVGLKSQLIDGVNISVQHILLGNDGFQMLDAFNIEPVRHTQQSIYADIDSDGDIDLVVQEPQDNGVKISVYTNIINN